MNQARRRLGDFGERVAAAHLEAKGYRILARNYRCREGEIDLVAQQGDVLVFVEVRARRGEGAGTAAESVTQVKAGRLVAAAQAYYQEHPRLPPHQRIDVVAVNLSPQGRLQEVEHIEGAVQA